jgi:precorrin-6B methylase 1
MCYGPPDWEGALSSKCVAKELMQVSNIISSFSMACSRQLMHTTFF